MTSNRSEMQAQLETVEPGSYERMLRYLAEGRQHYILSLEKVVNRDFRSLAVMGAHLAHMLRDTLEDLPVGIINIPLEDMRANRFPLEQVESDLFRLWV